MLGRWLKLANEDPQMNHMIVQQLAPGVVELECNAKDVAKLVGVGSLRSHEVNREVKKRRKIKCSSTSGGTRTMRSVCRRGSGDRNRRSWRGVDVACNARIKKGNRTRVGIRKKRNNTSRRVRKMRKEQEGSAEDERTRGQCTKMTRTHEERRAQEEREREEERTARSGHDEGVEKSVRRDDESGTHRR